MADVRQQIEVPGSRRANADAIYRSLRDAAIGDAFTVENLVLQRDSSVVTLKSGTIALTPPVMGRDTTAVFVGDAELVFQPLEPVERDHLKILTGEESVHESFDRALFCFTDNTGPEIRAQAKPHAADPKLGDILHDFRRHLRTRSENPRSQLEYMLTSESMDNIEADLLADTCTTRPSRALLQCLSSRAETLRPPALSRSPAAYSPIWRPEEVGIVNLDPQGEQEGIWHLGHLKSEWEQGKASSDQDDRVVRVDRYRIETVIAKNDRFTATAEIHFRAVTNADRVHASRPPFPACG